MASYFKFIAGTPIGILQTDKSVNKKAFYNFSFLMRLTQDANPLNEINNLSTCLSLPINSDHFILQNVNIKKQISYRFGGVGLTIGEPNCLQVLPEMTEILNVGFSDSIISTAFSIQEQNMIFIPFSHALTNFVHETEMKYNHKFAFKKNVNYLNAYLNMATHDTGDIATAFSVINLYWNVGAAVLDEIVYRYNILVSGIMEN